MREAGPYPTTTMQFPYRDRSLWTTQATWIAVAAVLAFWAIAAAIWPLTGSVVPWDSKNHFYPMLRYLGASLASGEWPLWNPYHFSGHPAVADPQSLLFTPTMVLFGWLVPQPSMQLFDIVVFAHLLPGGAGILGLFRRRNWHPAGAVLAAMVYILGGSASARLQHTGMIFSYGYFPLALLLLEASLDRRSYGRAFLFGIVAALLAVGRDQVAYLCCLALFGAVVDQVASAEKPLGYIRERVGVLTVMGVTGLILLAVPALLTIQFLTDSNRPSIGYDVAIMGSLPPQSLATLLFGNIFGSLDFPYNYWGPSPETLPEGTWTDRAIDYVFAGTVPALLLLWHGIAGRRLFAREFRYFLMLGIGALLYALGRYTPVFSLFYEHVPGVDLYRRPADATFVINVALAFAAGYLVHRYLAQGAPERPDTDKQTAGALCAAIAIILTAAATLVATRFAIRAGKLPEAITEIGIGVGIALAAVGAVAAAARWPRFRFATALVLVSLTGAELIARNAGSALNAEPAERYAVFERLPPEQLRGLQILTKELAARHAKGERPRVEILGLQGAWQNASMVLGLEDTLGYNPLRIADYEKAVGPGENAADPSLRQFPITFRNYRCRLASLLGLEYLVLDRPIERMAPSFPRLPNTSLLYGAGSMWIYKLPQVAPRVYLATHLIAVDSEQALEEDGLPNFDRSDEALIDEEDTDDLGDRYGLNEQAAKPEPINGSAAITNYRRNAVTIKVVSDRQAMLVLHDIYYPGWQVTVDGEEKRVRRVNLLFRGVEVPPGQHVVQFTFRPLSVNNLVAAAAEFVESAEGEGETATP